MAEIAAIDARGGTLAALADGYQPNAIGDAAYEQQLAIESGDRIVVGINAYTDDGEARGPEPQRIDPDLERSQVERTRVLRAGRDQSAVDAAMGELERAAAGTENVLPRIRACVEASATLGEISHALRRVWGEHRP